MRTINIFLNSAFFFVLRGFFLAILLSWAFVAKAQTPAPGSADWQTADTTSTADTCDTCPNNWNLPILEPKKDSVDYGGKIFWGVMAGMLSLQEDARYDGATAGGMVFYTYNAIPRLRLGAGVVSTYLNNAWMPKANEKYGRNEALTYLGGTVDIAYNVLPVNIDWTTVQNINVGFSTSWQRVVGNYRNETVEKTCGKPQDLVSFSPYVELFARTKMAYSLKIGAVMGLEDFGSIIGDGDKHKGFNGGFASWTLFFGKG